MAEAEEDWQGLPLEQQLTHKLWKARSHAYEALAKRFELAEGEDDDVFREWNRDSEWPRRAVTDSNAVAQEKGVQLVSVYARLGGRSATRCRPDCLAPLAEKCLAFSARKGTREAAVECLLGWAGNEADADKGEGLVAGMVEGLNAKQPKVVAGCVSALEALVAGFGVRTINPKPILKCLSKVFGHADKAVRAEGTSLVQTLYSFLGPALDPSLAELKPLQVKELHEAFAQMDAEGRGKGTGKPTRETANQMRERVQREAQDALEGTASPVAAGEPEGPEDQAEPEAVVEEAADPYDFADPVAVLAKLPPDFYDHLASAKWKERKEEALDPLLETLSTAIKIKPDHYDELVKALAGRMSDANILCVIGAANCLEKLAKGLRADFGRYRTVMTGPVLEKFKEKKANVVDALGNSLDAMAATVRSLSSSIERTLNVQQVAVSELVEDIVAFAKHKNPSVKEQTLRFLARALRNTPNALPKGDVKPLSDVLLAASEDAVVPVRDAASEGLGTLMKLVGPATFSPTLESLDDIRKAKVKEQFEKAEIKYRPAASKKAAPPAAAKPKPAAGPPSVGKPMMRAGSKPGQQPVDKENEPVPGSPQLKPPAAKAPARLMAKKPAPTAPPAAAPPPAAAVKKPAAVAGAKSAAPPAAAGAGKAIEPVKYKFSQEDAEARAPDMFEGTTFVDDIGNSVWKTRLAAMDWLLEWLGNGKAAEVEPELVVRFLNKKPGPKESNFQVWQRVLSTYQLLADQSPTFSKACMALSIPALTEKYGDAKFKDGAGGALAAYAEKSSLGFVLTQAFEPMSKQKAPKVQAEDYLYVESALRDFGIAGVPVRDLIEYIKTGLKGANAAVRTNATKCLVTTRLCVGADISNFLQDLNPQLLSTIESEFGKIAGEAPPAPTRTSADLAPVAGVSGAAKGKGKAATEAPAGADPLDDLFPRVEIDKLVTGPTVKACDDAAWKARKEALEQIQGILEANKRLKPSLGGDLTTALKQRLTDANKACQGLALDIIARIATGMGKPFDRFAKPFLAGIVAVLADKNAGARTWAINTLTAISDACGLDIVVPNLATGLEAPKPELRSSALAWLVARMQGPDADSGPDLSSLAGPVVSCLEDRSPEVRKAAQTLVPFVIASAGLAAVIDQVSSLKPASRSTVMPLIEAAKASVPARTTAAPAPPKPAAAKPAATPTAPTVSSHAIPMKPIPRPGGVGRSLRPAATATSTRTPTPSEEAPGLAVKPKAAMKRPGAPVSRPGTSAAPSPALSTYDIPFKSSDPKPKTVRAAKETGTAKWVIDGAPRKDQIEQLHVQMGPCVSPELLGQLFSKDHHAERDFLAALGVIEGWAMDPAAAAERCEIDEKEVRARLGANLDLVFKYITIRLADTNTSMTMKCLDLVEQLFGVLHTDGLRMSDYEASVLLPSLVAKSGDSKEIIRNRIRAIYKSACTVYPFSHVFSALLTHGLKSKNARVRAESAEELSALFQRRGYGVCQPGKALPVIASLIGDRDPAARNGALSALASAYSCVGDEIIKHVGNLSAKDSDMLWERLKRTEAPAKRPGSSASSSRPESRQDGPSPPRPAPAASARVASGIRRPSAAHGLGAAAELRANGTKSPRPASPSAAGPSRIARPGGLPQATGVHRREPSDASTIRPPSSRLSSVRPPPARPNREAPIADILSNDETKSTEALKAVQDEIARLPDALVAQADSLIDAISAQMIVAFESLDADTPGSRLRLCKHILQTLSVFFDQPDLARAVSKASLGRLIAQLTQRLQETANNQPTDSLVSISRILNMVLIRIFHNSERSACFGALFQVLQTTSADIRTIDDEQELSHRAQYAELVMKCLWKVSKTLQESLEDGTLDTRVLLKDIDDFLNAIPPAEWRRRANDNVPLGDMPLRTLKTILQQIVTTFGDGVYDMLGLIDNPDNAFVYQYLFRLLNYSKTASEGARPQSAAATAASPAPAPAAQLARPTTPPPQPNGHASVASPRPDGDALHEVDLNNELTEVFERIGNPSESKKGIAELYELLKRRPEAKPKVDRWIANTGTYFQQYLRRALNNLRQEDEERGGTPVDVPSPLPPASPRPASKPASAAPSPNPDSRPRTGSREQDLTRLQSLFGFGQ